MVFVFHDAAEQMAGEESFYKAHESRLSSLFNVGVASKMNTTKHKEHTCGDLGYILHRIYTADLGVTSRVLSSDDIKPCFF